MMENKQIILLFAILFARLFSVSVYAENYNIDEHYDLSVYGEFVEETWINKYTGQPYELPGEYNTKEAWVYIFKVLKQGSRPSQMSGNEKNDVYYYSWPEGDEETEDRAEYISVVMDKIFFEENYNYKDRFCLSLQRVGEATIVRNCIYESGEEKEEERTLLSVYNTYDGKYYDYFCANEYEELFKFESYFVGDGYIDKYTAQDESFSSIIDNPAIYEFVVTNGRCFETSDVKTKDRIYIIAGESFIKYLEDNDLCGVRGVMYATGKEYNGEQIYTLYDFMEKTYMGTANQFWSRKKVESWGDSSTTAQTGNTEETAEKVIEETPKEITDGSKGISSESLNETQPEENNSMMSNTNNGSVDSGLITKIGVFLAIVVILAVAEIIVKKKGKK